MYPEWLAFILPLALVAFLLFRSSAIPRFKWWTLLAISLVGLPSAWLWSARAMRQSHSFQELCERVPTQGRPGGYVSSDKCQSCHPSQYESWHHTFHRTMTQLASPSSIVGNFDNVKLELGGKSFLLERRGDEFWVQMDDPQWVPPTQGLGEVVINPAPPRVWKRIGLLTGSHHMQVYWIGSEHGNMQMIFPFAWLKEDQRWVPVQQTFLRDPAKPPAMHVWNVNCLKCHATGGQPREDESTHLMSTRVGELGIACEACHGPGEAHVAANENPIRRYAMHWRRQPDPTIVNPKRLPARLSSEVCGQCHGIKWLPASEHWREEGFSFRPGDELDRSTPVVRPAHLDLQPWLKQPLQSNPSFLDEHYWPDGMVRVSGRDFNGLVEAPCHQRGTLACTSCHSLHQSDPNNQLAAGMETNEACLQCHGSMRARLQEHTHHLAQSSGSLCYNCHMPHTVYGLLKGIRSHQIDSPKVATTLATGRPNACNLCHLDKSLAWTSQYLSQWFGQAAPSMSPEQEKISAVVLDALRGDAGQRALAAYSMGWAPARQASGERWLVPYLAFLLDDPYSAVRYVADRSLKALPGNFKQIDYDFISDETTRRQAVQHLLDLWEKQERAHLDRTGPELLLASNGVLDNQKLLALLKQRNNRSMDLQE
jgi:predicted CXXCH cytochrome family protein